MYKAAFFDVDGTLKSFSSGVVPASAVRALEMLRERDVKVVLATGRHKTDLGEICSLFDFDAFITLNGQYCYDREGTVLRAVPLDAAAVAVAVEQAKAGLYPCYFVGAEEKYVSRMDDRVREVCELVGAEAVVREPGDREGELYQLSVYLSREDEWRYLERARNVETARWHPYFMDVIPRGGGKMVGVQAVMDCFGMAGAEAMAFGDGENDAGMLAGVTLGIAMGDAGEEAKQAARYITDTVDNDGILKAVEKFMA